MKNHSFTDRQTHTQLHEKKIQRLPTVLTMSQLGLHVTSKQTIHFELEQIAQ